MIELLLKTIEKLKELAEVRDKRAEKIFEKFIEPIYKDIEAIHKDYLETLHQLAAVFSNPSSEVDVLRELCRKTLEIVEPRSQELEVTRDTIRACASLKNQYKGDTALFMDAVSDYLRGFYNYEVLHPSVYHHWTTRLRALSERWEVDYYPADLSRVALDMMEHLKKRWDKLSRVFVKIKLKVVSQ